MISKDIGAQMVEIHTGLYANTTGKGKDRELARVKKAAKKAMEMALMVNAGHGLNYSNVKRIASLGGLRGLYIGHSIVSMAVYVGLEKAVKEMKRLIQGSKK